MADERKTKITLDLSISNLGCLNSLHFNRTLTGELTKKICIYAKNGTGKTLISKAFALIEKEKSGEIASYDKNSLITIGEDKAKLEFKYYEDAEINPEKLDIELKKNQAAIINNKTKFFFHVFNAEFVEKHLKTISESNKINGYIIGEDNIVDKSDKDNLTIIKEAFEKMKQSIYISISKAKSTLDDLNVNKKTNEYSIFSYDYIVNQKRTQEKENFSTILKQFNLIKSFPELSEDIKRISTIKDLDLSEFQTLLISPITVEKISEDFKNKIKGKESFIEKGIDFYNMNSAICPFCNQEIRETSENLINEYIIYFKNEEAKVCKKLDVNIDLIENYERDLNTIQKEYLQTKLDYNDIKKYFYEYSTEEIPDIDFKKILETLLHLKNEAKNKKDNIKKIIDVKDIISMFIYENSIISKKIDEVNTKTTALNIAKTKIKGEILTLKKRMCNSLLNEVITECTDIVEEIRQTQDMILVLSKKIEEQNNSSRKDKKKAVAETFDKYLKMFFNDKYKLNRADFSLTFKEKSYSEGYEKILSDGEKNVLAFCYYLAIAHTLINKSTDYEKLFYIIDDPINSMDFTYVYTIASIIDQHCIDSFKSKKSPMIIFTHNQEFMNILIRNKIKNLAYIFDDKGISELKGELISPYESHLADVYNVSINKIEPCHTTCNSIRHIIETICKFMTPEIDIEKFIANENFNDCPYLNRLIQDMSHGILRSEVSYTPDMLKCACKELIEYMRNKLPGQIELIQKRYK